MKAKEHRLSTHFVTRSSCKKFEREKKITDFSLLLPCEANLKLHIKRANYVASIFRKAGHWILNPEDQTSHGWDETGRVIWSSVCYPKDVFQLLIGYEENEEITHVEGYSDLEEDFDDVIEEDD